MEFWQVFIALSALAAVFIVWPTVFGANNQKKALRSHQRTETNEHVYDQHFEDLEQTLLRGEVSQQEYGQLKRDLENTLVEENSQPGGESDAPIVASFKSRIPVLALALAVPLCSLVLYSILGSKSDWEIYQRAVSIGSEGGDERVAQAKALVESLQHRLKDKPGNTQNWYLLATTAVELGEFDEGVRAYQRLLEIEPDAVRIKAEYAQALFLRAGNTITPEVRKHTQEALAMAPDMPIALGLAGIDAYQSGDYSLAIDFWQKAVVQLEPNSPASQVLTAGIARAQVAISRTGAEVASPSASSAKVAEAGEAVSAPNIEVNVALDKEKLAGVSSEAMVFVYARAWQGPKMPLAIRRMKVSDLPAKVVLDRSVAMTQGMDLSSFPQVEVVARISGTGSAISASGDWQVSQGPIIVASQKDPLSLVISEQLP